MPGSVSSTGPVRCGAARPGSRCRRSSSRTPSSLNDLGVEQLVPRRLAGARAARPGRRARAGRTRDVSCSVGCGHPLERVVEVDDAIVDAELLQLQDHREHRAASPHAALGEAAGHIPRGRSDATASSRPCSRCGLVIVYGLHCSTMARSTASTSVGAATSGTVNGVEQGYEAVERVAPSRFALPNFRAVETHLPSRSNWSVVNRCERYDFAVLHSGQRTIGGVCAALPRHHLARTSTRRTGAIRSPTSSGAFARRSLATLVGDSTCHAGSTSSTTAAPT